MIRLMTIVTSLVMYVMYLFINVVLTSLIREKRCQQTTANKMFFSQYI